MYSATDTETGELLAVKKVDPPPNEKRERRIRAIQEECRILATLDHENIIRIKNHGFGPGDTIPGYFAFMERASGGELLARVPRRTGLLTQKNRETFENGFFAILAANLVQVVEIAFIHGILDVS